MAVTKNKGLLIVSSTVEAAEQAESLLGTGDFNIAALVSSPLSTEDIARNPNFQTIDFIGGENMLRSFIEGADPKNVSKVIGNAPGLAGHMVINITGGNRLLIEDSASMISERVNKFVGNALKNIKVTPRGTGIAALAIGGVMTIRHMIAQGEMKNMDNVSEKRYHLMREMSGYDKPAPQSPRYYKSQPPRQQIAPTNRIIVDTEEYINEDELQKLMLEHIQLDKNYFS
jgi:hypothetical protein